MDEADSCIVPEMIHRMAVNHPEAVAVSDRRQSITFRQLHNGARQFASYLAECGVVNGSSVVICFERSVDWIIAALGAMWAGAAYVPIDIDWPEARIRFVLEDSGATTTICSGSLIKRLELGRHGIDPILDAAKISRTRHHDLVPPDANDLAYMIYTSGSSGSPKAVEISHSNLADLAAWHRTAFAITPEDRASHFAALGFDAAVWEIWPNLCAGACVCVAPDYARTSAAAVQEWILRERVTVAFVPTVYASPLLSLQWPANAQLRILLTGGEALKKAPPGGLPFDVFNNYGPTECTVVATYARLRPGCNEVPPIGNPRRGANVYLLSEQGDPVPDGAPGEIYISGACVGRGYKNLPDLTVQRFQADRFNVEAGGKMFRTGDIAVRQSDGQLRFLGRIDRQVKIRGRRVELDEIGTALGRHPYLDFATAIVELDTNGAQQLVAYYQVKEKSAEPGEEDLRTYLMNVLPLYMVPKIFRKLRDLPLSPNGKVDLAAIGQLRNQHQPLLKETETSGRGSSIESRMLSAIRCLLKNDALDSHDDFFLAGGDSLFGTQLILLLRDEFGADLTFDQLFEAGTVKNLTALLESTEVSRNTTDDSSKMESPPQCAGSNQYTKQTPIRDDPRELILVPPPRKRKPLNPRVYWIRPTTPFARVLEEHQEVKPLCLSCKDIEALSDTPSVSAIAELFVRQICELNGERPYCVGGLCIDGVLAYEVARQLSALGMRNPLLVLLDCPDPTDLCKSHPLSPRLHEPSYIVKRALRLGLRASLVKLRDRVIEQYVRRTTSKGKHGPLDTVQKLVHASIPEYSPGQYAGNALLIMASNRAPHVDLAQKWKALIRGTLAVEFVDGHHDDLMKDVQMRQIADLIAQHLPSLSNFRSAAVG